MQCNVIIDTFGGGFTHAVSVSCLESLIVAKTSSAKYPQLSSLVSKISVFAVPGHKDASANVASALFHARQLRDTHPQHVAVVADNISHDQFFQANLLPDPEKEQQTPSVSPSSSLSCTFFCFSTKAPSKEALALLRRILVARRTHVIVISALTPRQEVELRGVLETASGSGAVAAAVANGSSGNAALRSVLWLRTAHLTPPTQRPPAHGTAPVNSWCSSLLELLCAGIALGITRNFPVPASQNADLVPIDVAVNVALLSFLMPQKPTDVRSVTSSSRIRELRVVSLLSSPTDGLIWQMVGEYILDYYGRYEAQLHGEMPHGSFQRDPVLSFKVKLGENAWNYAETVLNAPFNMYRAVRSHQQKGSLLRTPYSATSDKIRSLISDLDEQTQLEQTASPQFRGAVDEDEEDTYGMLVRYLSLRRETAPLVLACSLGAVEWEPYLKRVAVDVLHFIAVRIMSLPEAPKLPTPTPAWTNDIFFRSEGRAPAPNLPWRRMFETTTFGLLAGRQANGQFVELKPGGTHRRFQDILAQSHIQVILEQVSKKDNVDRASMESRALRILAGIGDTQNHRDGRSLATVVRAVFKQLYTHINVLPRGFLTHSLLFKAWKVPRTSVVLIPSHRSYIDFMVTPYLLCGLGLPQPHIVAGEDFLRLGPLANALRGSGAFFMRRTFKTDKLYAALFKEYVRNLTLQFEWLEFFIEGMRSRSGKTMPPRMGILKMITDSFYESRDQINDVLFVPCALSYERLLESSLYARELLGIPKPPENLANLVKGSVLVVRESFGSLNVNFGEPISLVRVADELKIAQHGEPNEAKRAARSFTPARLLTALAGRISQSLDDNMIVTPTAIVASVILYMTDRRALRDDGVPLDQIAVNTEWLRGVVLRNGGTMAPNFAALDGSSLVWYCTSLLQPHITVSRLNRAYTFGAGKDGPGDSDSKSRIRDQITALMALSIYHNGLIHLFLAPGAVSVVLSARKNQQQQFQQQEQFSSNSNYNNNKNNNNTKPSVSSPSGATTDDGDDSTSSTTKIRAAVARATGSSVDPKAPSSQHPPKSLASTEEEVRFLHTLLENEFPSYARLVPSTDPFKVGCSVLEKQSCLLSPSCSSFSSPSTTTLSLTNNAFTQFCSMSLYPYVEAYFTAALSLFALTAENVHFDELHLLGLCHRISLEFYDSHLVTFAQACNKEMLKTALVSYRVGSWGIMKLEQETGLASRIMLNSKFQEIQNAELRKFVLTINQYRWHPASLSDIGLCIQKVLNAAKNSQEVLSKL